MQTTSDFYKSLLANAHTKTVRILIAGEEFLQPHISSLFISGGLFANNCPEIGSCVAREIDLAFVPGSFVPPRMAEINVEIQLTNGSESSEWIPKGTFYIDTRETDSSGILTIHGYDAMLKAEQTFLDEGDPGEWPRAMDAVVDEIAERMGVELDERTVIDETYLVEYPNDYTMREILGYIAVAHAGNWIITDTGKLRLVGLADIPAEFGVLVTEDGEAITFGEVMILV